MSGSLQTVIGGPAGDEISAEHINQLVQLLQGFRNVPIQHFTNDPSAWRFTGKNAGAGSKDTIIYAADGTTVLFQIDGGGVRASIDGSGAVALVSQAGTETLTNKTFTNPVLNGAVSGTAGFDAWTDWDPDLTQGAANPTSSNQSSRWNRQGNDVKVTGNITATSAGSAGAIIQISTLPAVPAYLGAGAVLGTYVYTVPGVTFHEGSVVLVNSTTVTLVKDGFANFLGAAPSFAIAIDDIIQFSLSYEAAP